VRFLGKLAAMSDRGIEIHFLLGNHEIRFFDYLTAEVGVILHSKPFTVELYGKNFFLAHGDEVGYRSFKYRFIQRILRSRLSQTLYGAIHPRWSVGFARSWSLRSRKRGLASEKIKLMQAHTTKALEDFSRNYLQKHPDIHYFIYGHVHLQLDRELASSTRLLITGDWMYHFSYAVWDGEKMMLQKYF
jgi:UDP-2,3-diacylglucosamine hydrolase